MIGEHVTSDAAPGKLAIGVNVGGGPKTTLRLVASRDNAGKAGSIVEHYIYAWCLRNRLAQYHVEHCDRDVASSVFHQAP